MYFQLTEIIDLCIIIICMIKSLKELFMEKGRFPKI